METEATVAGLGGGDGFVRPLPSGSPASDTPAPELDRLRQELATAKSAAEESQRKYLLALADLDNFRKLAEKRAADRLASNKRSTLTKFLPVLDNLTRALAFEQDSEGLRGGLQATMRGFESLLASEQVTAITVVGAPFDPRTAEAITTRDSGGSRRRRRARRGRTRLSTRRRAAAVPAKVIGREARRRAAS